MSFTVVVINTDKLLVPVSEHKQHIQKENRTPCARRRLCACVGLCLLTNKEVCKININDSVYITMEKSNACITTIFHAIVPMSSHLARTAVYTALTIHFAFSLCVPSFSLLTLIFFRFYLLRLIKFICSVN